MAYFEQEINKFSVEKTANILGIEPSTVFLWRIVKPGVLDQITTIEALKPFKTKEELRTLQAFLRLCKRCGASKVAYTENKNIDLDLSGVSREVERSFIESILPEHGWRLWIYSP